MTALPTHFMTISTPTQTALSPAVFWTTFHLEALVVMPSLSTGVSRLGNLFDRLVWVVISFSAEGRLQQREEAAKNTVAGQVCGTQQDSSEFISRMRGSVWAGAAS
jgi:hypothetical protein